MRRKKLRAGAFLATTCAVNNSKLVDKEIEPIIKEAEKKLNKVAKKEGFYINGLIWIHKT